MKQTYWSFIQLCFLCLMVIGTDRLSKAYMLVWQPYNDGVVAPYLSFDLVFNRGVSWGMLHTQEAGSTHPALLFIICAIIVIFTLHTYVLYRCNRHIAGHLLVLAGALSNVYDRLVYGAVIDFIRIQLAGYAFPVFNIADAAITLGVLYMLYAHYYLDRGIVVPEGSSHA